ncbi:MAG: gliding motility lipoprotein GldH [Weeksellaceae bacterium]|nr:gliding motility lipoprotein GldH [Weeksellaceae bacterium]
MSKHWTILVCILLMAYGCQNSSLYFEEVAVVGGEWREEDKKTFKLPVRNTDQNFTLYFIIRNDNNYPFSNIYFFSELVSPQGDIVKDTLEYQMAFASGEWIGFGMGEIKQNTMVYKENIALKDTGIYQVKLQHAMRDSILPGIVDVSLMVEKN